MDPVELVTVAQRLLLENDGRPGQVAIRRAVSTTYYALFHTLAHSCANALIGAEGGPRDPAWRQVYRALDHSYAKKQCRSARIAEFQSSVQAFADLFVSLQEKRHGADYDPSFETTREDADLDVSEVLNAIVAFQEVAFPERRAFAAFVLLKERP